MKLIKEIIRAIFVAFSFPLIALGFCWGLFIGCISTGLIVTEMFLSWLGSDESK
jgi:hypothetical protein